LKNHQHDKRQQKNQHEPPLGPRFLLLRIFIVGQSFLNASISDRVNLGRVRSALLYGCISRRTISGCTTGSYPPRTNG
jgi:hypothetical protein